MGKSLRIENDSMLSFMVGQTFVVAGRLLELIRNTPLVEGFVPDPCQPGSVSYDESDEREGMVTTILSCKDGMTFHVTLVFVKFDYEIARVQASFPINGNNVRTIVWEGDETPALMSGNESRPTRVDEGDSITDRIRSWADAWTGQPA